MSQTPQLDLTTQLDIDLDSEWPIELYNDGPVTIRDIPLEYQTFDRVNWIRLKQMIDRWPAMRKSWEAFIIDYHICLSTLEAEDDDDIPF